MSRNFFTKNDLLKLISLIKSGKFDSKAQIALELNYSRQYFNALLSNNQVDIIFKPYLLVKKGFSSFHPHIDISDAEGPILFEK